MCIRCGNFQCFFLQFIPYSQPLICSLRYSISYHSSISLSLFLENLFSKQFLVRLIKFFSYYFVSSLFYLFVIKNSLFFVIIGICDASFTWSYKYPYRGYCGIQLKFCFIFDQSQVKGKFETMKNIIVFKKTDFNYIAK